MILHGTGSTRLCITQPDHAALSGRIMAAWRADGFEDSPRREVILLAIREHDNGWREPDSAPILDAGGAVLDFTNAPDEVRRAVWPRGTARLAHEPYAAALVAMHATHVLRRYRGQPAWLRFFDEMDRARAHHLESAGESPGTLAQDYLFVRVGDLLSLTFCNGWTSEQRDDSGSGYSTRLEGDRLLVTPDPFGGNEVTLEVEARELPERFASQAEAKSVFAAARQITLTGTAAAV